MAKKTIESPFARTEPGQPEQDNSDLDEGNIRPSGVGLREGEIKALDAIAEQYGVSRNALIRYATRDFIIQHRAGNIDLSDLIEAPPPPRKRIRYSS